MISLELLASNPILYLFQFSKEKRSRSKAIYIFPEFHQVSKADHLNILG